MSKEAVIEWRVAPKHLAPPLSFPADAEWEEHSRCPAEGAEFHAQFLEESQSEPGLFEFRVKPE